MVNQNKSNSKPVEAEGKTVYGFSSYDNVSYRIDAEYLYNLMVNPYVCAPLNTLRSTTFIGPPTVKVKDAEGEINEELSKEYKYNVLDINKVDYLAIQAWEDNVWGGCSVFSPTIEKKNGKLVITEIRHLPWYSFSQNPPGSIRKYNPVMPGIVWNDQTNQVEVWQSLYLTYGSTDPIKNFFIIKDPAGADPAGESGIVPVIPIISAINLADKGENLRINRVAAPNVFVRITDDFLNDTMRQYLDAFTKKWGSSTGFILPNNCELIDPHLTESGAALERLEYLKKILNWYFFPTDAVSKDGTLIGGSDAGATQILLNSISYELSYIEAAFEDIYNVNLKANGYDGYTIEIRFPRPNIDRTESIIKQIDQAVKGKAILPNEIRANLPDLNLKELDEDGLSELSSIYAQAAAFGNTTTIDNISSPMFGNREINKRVSKTEKELSDATDEYKKIVGETVWEDKNFQKYNEESDEPINYREFMRSLMGEE